MVSPLAWPASNWNQSSWPLPVSVSTAAPPFSTSCSLPPISVSLASPPSSTSLPAPPFSVSVPPPPSSRSLPLPPLSVSPAEPPISTSLPSPPSRVEATLEARIVSLPLPPTAVSTTVSKAMAMLLVRPPALEKVPGVRSTVAFCGEAREVERVAGAVAPDRDDGRRVVVEVVDLAEIVVGEARVEAVRLVAVEGGVARGAVQALRRQDVQYLR